MVVVLVAQNLCRRRVRQQQVVAQTRQSLRTRRSKPESIAS
jgi:hypothetical protein